MSKPSKQAAPKRAQRTCSVCGLIWTQPAYGWDVNLVAGEMVDTCSAGCRRKANLPERRRV